MIDLPSGPRGYDSVFQVLSNQFWIALDRIAVATTSIVEVLKQVSVFERTTNVTSLTELEIALDKPPRIGIVRITLKMW